MSNLGAMSRVLRRAGLRTGRHRWNHDANADARDSYQVGTIRFPTKSHSLWTLALFGITHYMWMKDDGDAELRCTACLKGNKRLGYWTCANPRCEQPQKPLAEFSRVRAEYKGKRPSSSAQRCDICLQRFEAEEAALLQQSMAKVPKAPTP